jgi:hypothetical protein
MKAFEFHTHISANGTVSVPEEVIAQLTHEQSVRVILLVPEQSARAEWGVLTAEQFLKGYADSDAVYDQLRES